MQNSFSMRKKVISGLFWKFSERILAQVVTFVVSIILARMLEPSTYGAIAIVNVFIALANVFVSDGFGNALVQKKNADEVDFSSVFYFNIAMSVVVYIVVFLCAPFIAAFYKTPILCPVLRVLGLKLILAGINSVQHAYVSSHMMFKKFFWSTLGGTLGSAVVGIAMAYLGYGIWALAAQYMFNSLLDTVILWLSVKWRPKKVFSFKRLSGLFSYGWKILSTALVRTGYKELRSIVIGKAYTVSDLAHYSKGRSFPSLIVTNIYVAVKSVVFPAMSRVQDQKQVLKTMTRRLVRIHSYTLLPLLMGLALVAEPLVKLLLTEKWLFCVPYLQAFCILSSLEPIQTANLQAIKAIGRSDIYLKLEIIKKSIGIIVLIISMRYGVWAIAVGEIAAELLAALINIFPNKKLLGYGYIQQIRDTFSAIVPLCAMVVVVVIIGQINIGVLPLLLIQVALGAAVYIGASAVTKNSSFLYVLSLINDTIFRKKVNE